MTLPTLPREKLEEIREEYRGKILGGPSEEGLRKADLMVQARFNRYPQGYTPQPDDLNEVPNYDKLSRGERRIMGWLPGIAESGVGKALAKFADSPFGKILQVFDIGAEVLERGTGFATQALAAVGTPESWSDFTENIGAAWYAGSLAADMANLPRWRDDAFEIPSDLPGFGGLITARKQIVELMNQGMDADEALVLVRDEYYNGLGALALRAQLHDAFFHIAADPINIVIPYVKPIERLRAVTIARVTGKALPEAIVQDVAELTKLLDKVIGEGGAAERIAEIERAIVWTKNVPLISPGQQKLLKLMGEIPLEGTGAATRIWSSRWNIVRKAFSLTPDAKAMEAATQVSDSILARIGNLSDPEDMVKFVSRISDGTLSPEFGHMIVSVQGRQVRAAAQASEVAAIDLLRAYRATAGERNILNYVARYTGDDIGEVYRLIKNGDEVAVYNKFANSVSELGDDAVQIMEDAATIGLTDGNSLKIAVDIFGDTPLITPELFRINLVSDIVEATTRNLVAKYGVDARGFVVKFAAMVKSAETLAFLRMNPGYPIRNFINNEFTMLARGTWGGLGTKGAELFWERLGFEPTRLRVGMGPAEISVAAMKGDAKMAGQAALASMNEVMAEVTAGTRGWTDKVSDWFKNIDLKGFDTGIINSKIESNASIRAFTAGAKRWFSKYKKTIKIADVNPGLASTISAEYGDDMLRTIQRALGDALTDAELDAVFLSDNIGLTEGNIVGLFNEKAGFDLFGVIEAEEAGPMIQRLLDVAERPSALRDEALNLKRIAQTHLQSSHDEMMVDFTMQLASRVEAEGVGSFPRIAGEAVDEFWGYQQKAQWDMQRLADVARTTLTKEGAEAAQRTWRAIQSKRRITFGKVWDRLEWRGQAISDGVETIIKQLDDAGKLTPEARQALRGFGKETTGRLKSWRKNWDEFFTLRDTELDNFFQSKIDKTTWKRTWEQLEEHIGEAYNKAIDGEDDILRQIDEIASAVVPEGQRPLFMAWRDSVAKIRRADREAVVAFRESIKGLSGAERELAHQQFLPERLKAIEAIIEEEKIGIQAMMGNEVAAARFAPEEFVQWKETQSRILEGIELEADDIELAERFRAGIPESGDTLRLREKFGEFSDDAVTRQMDTWSDLLRPSYESDYDAVLDAIEQAIKSQDDPEILSSLEVNKKMLVDRAWTPESANQHLMDILGTESTPADDIHNLLQRWATIDGRYKKALIEYVQNNPEEAKAVQDFAQWWLRENGFENVELHSGKLQLYRGFQPQPGAGLLGLEEVPLDKLKIRPWDSFTGNSFVASQLSAAGTPVLKFEIPVENIFTHFKAHPGISLRHEAEFILNELGLENARFLSIDGRVPTAEELEIIARNFPNVALPQPETGIDIPSMPDFHNVVPDELFKGIGDQQLYHSRTDEIIDTLRDTVMEQANRKDLKLSNLDVQSQQELRQFIELAKGKLADDRYQAVKFGEWMRDSALLNYNRRKNYNTWLGVLAPYEFWFTQSAWKWALHSLDRPAMASTYFKMEKFLRTGFRPDRGRPSRLEGNIRVKLPFLPEWMGDGVFIDPMRSMLPFKQFAYPWERHQQEQQGEEYDAERVLRELLNDEEISQDEYDETLLNRNGPIWDRAISLAQQDESDEKLNTFDFMSMFAQPHAPLMWAYNAARGKPEEIGPFLPITRSVRAVTAALGIGPNGGVNIEGAIRRELGLPEFDQWDDYRIDRMLSNMAAMGEITTEEALGAMMDRTGLIFEEAERKAGEEWGFGSMGSTLGLPLKFYPEGERRLRTQRDAYERAWADYEAIQDYDLTLGRFHEENPGYEARLALWKSPEDRLKSFMIDEIWNIYNDLPDLNRRELKEQMGDMFNNAFLNKETRSYDSITPENLAVWLRLMGGEAPGQLSPATDIPPIKLTDPDFANRMQVFYDAREYNFRYYATGGIRDIQKKYFMLEKGARKEYLVQNPILKQYWDWRRDFMLRNPDLIPYIEDDPDKRPKYESIAELEQAFAQQPRFTPLELQSMLGVPLVNLIQSGQPLPAVANKRLERIAGEIGLSSESILNQIAPQTAQPVAPTPEPSTVISPSVGEPQPEPEGTGLFEGPRPSGGIARIAYDIITGIKTLGEFLRPAKKEEKSHLKYALQEEFPGLTPEFLKIIDYAKVREAPEVLSRMTETGKVGTETVTASRGGVDIRFSVIGHFVEINGLNLVHDLSDRNVVLHELAHVADRITGGTYPSISGSSGFRQATLDVREMFTEKEKYQDEPYCPIIELTWTFPGIGGNEKTPVMNWGGPHELYATIFGVTKGYLDNIPPPMRPYYERWMTFAPPQGQGRVPPQRERISGGRP